MSFISVEEHCNEAVVFSMSNLMRFKDYVKSCPEDLTSVDEYKKLLILPHEFDGYECEPCSIPRASVSLFSSTLTCFGLNLCPIHETMIPLLKFVSIYIALDKTKAPINI